MKNQTFPQGTNQQDCLGARHGGEGGVGGEKGLAGTHEHHAHDHDGEDADAAAWEPIVQKFIQNSNNNKL